MSEVSEQILLKQQAETTEGIMLSSKLSSKVSKLQSYYLINVEIGLIASLLVMIGVFNAPIYNTEEQEVNVEEQEVAKMEEVIQTEQQERVPPPPRPPVPTEVPNDEVIEEDNIDFSSELNMQESLELPPEPPESANDDAEEESEDDVFVVVERMPELKGGIRAVQEKVQYPELARKADIEGRVVVQFVIDKNGKPMNPKVIRGIGGGCDKEAIRVVKQLEFTPGMQRGKPVKVQFTLPINFKLRQKN